MFTRLFFQTACLTLCLFFNSIVLCLPAAADIYQWVDDDGNIIYGDRPAGSTDATLIKSDEEIAQENEKFGITNEHRNGQYDFIKAADERLQAQKKAQAKQKKAAAKQAALCNQLQARLKHRARVNRLVRYTNDGDYHYLSDEERQAADRRLKEATEKACSRT